MKSIRIATDIPGPRSRALAKRREASVVNGHASVTPIYAASAEGWTITDVDGNVFLDFAGGIGSANAGHRNPAVLGAVSSQLNDFLHLCFTVTPYEPYIALAEKLNAIAPGRLAKKTLLVNSGAEAIENAVKVARHATGRPNLIAFEHAFHGRTLLTMSLTHKEMPYKHGFGPFFQDVHRIPYPYPLSGGAQASARALDSLLARIGAETVAAIVIELVTGEGGFYPADKRFVADLRTLTSERGIVLIVDEVQTGLGRTGKMFACDWYGLEPDLVAMAKSLGGGLPLAAVTGRTELMDSVHRGGLGGTFGGNPLSCAAALGAIEAIEDLDSCGRLGELAAHVPERLKGIASRSRFVTDVRGLGCMMALEIGDGEPEGKPSKERAERVARGCIEDGVILILSGTEGNVIRLLMPLTISEEALEEGIAIIESNILKLE